MEIIALELTALKQRKLEGVVVRRRMEIIALELTALKRAPRSRPPNRCPTWRS